MTEESNWKQFFDNVRIGVDDDLGTTVVTQEQLDDTRRALDDPEAAFPVLHQAREAPQQMYSGSVSRVNARSIRQYFNAPIPGKKIYLKGGIAEKYMRRDLPYVVDVVTATDEDGRLIETMTVHQLLRTQRVGEKRAQGERR